MQTRQLIIFSDLDGTLLDHHSYSWERARPALAKISELRIPLILCTSKTAAEVSKIHLSMNLRHPYIVENGAAIVFPEAEDCRNQNAHFLGRHYSDLLPIVQKIRQDGGYRFTGFYDMTASEVAAETGLTSEQSKLAKDRLSTEPLKWEDSDVALDRFKADLAKLDLRLVQGGRFYHILDSKADKGNALLWLLDYFKQNHTYKNWFSVALGDGPNDQSMLEAADLAVIIPSVSGRSPNPYNSKILHATEPGPCGWNRAILNIVELYSHKGADHG